ncbi:amiloride-sensitive sodium channel subunit gamma-like [Physella acuta]|uniref:amiloride-sensitive sodium channel subunit gamma-like n=1 Tax=Physella acuta TaxID=109671 RepID=UPI0027DB4176|nr:amiloride-sensitive sodium channel subunit gamma-like [Physella acuta]
MPKFKLHELREINEMYQDFGQMTTMHGIKRAAVSKQLWIKLIWTGLVIAALSYAFYQISQTVNTYYSYPSSIGLSIEADHELELPAVTICNLNRIRVSKADFLQSHFEEWKMNNLTVPQQMQKLSIALHNYSRESKEELGHKVSDMMLSCLFNSDACNASDFKLDTFINNGNCYTFGDKTVNNSKSWFVTKAGPANGLIIELDIEQDEYLPITESAGIKVLLHSGSEIVFPDNSGILAAPGFVTSIGIRRSETSLLPAPYGNCISQSNVSNEIKNLYKNMGYDYTKDACLRTCLQIKIHDSCDCIETDVANIIQVLNDRSVLDLAPNETLQICNTTHTECVTGVEEQFQKRLLGCEDICLPVCEQIGYLTTVSTATWPAKRYMENYIQFVNNSATANNKTYNWTGEPRQHALDNFLRLEIYYETLRYESFASSPTFDWNSLLGNIGGQLGLWLGFSVLTAIEVCQFILEVSVHVGRIYYRKHRKSKNTEEQNENSTDRRLSSAFAPTLTQEDRKASVAFANSTRSERRTSVPFGLAPPKQETRRASLAVPYFEYERRPSFDFVHIEEVA